MCLAVWVCLKRSSEISVLMVLLQIGAKDFTVAEAEHTDKEASEAEGTAKEAREAKYAVKKIIEVKDTVKKTNEVKDHGGY